MPNITKNHAITLAVTTNRRPQRFFVRFKPAVWWTSINLYHGFPRFSSTRRNMPAFKLFLQYFATGSDTASCQDYGEYEIVECLSEEIQIIDLFKHCKLQPHTCKLSQYTPATRLRFGNFRILFDNMKNEKEICKLQNLFSKTASVQTKPLSLVGVISFVPLNLCSLAIDLSRIPVHKGFKSRLGWTKYSDLYEIVQPSLVLIFLFAHWSGMRERSIRLFDSRVFTQSNKLVIVDT